MAGIIGSLKILSSVNTSGFNKGLKQMSTGLTGFASKFASVGKQAATIGAGIGVAIGGVAVASLTSWTKHSLEAIDATAKLSTQLGISTEAMTSWTYNAGLSGVATSDLENGLQKLAINLGDAKNGVTSATSAFEKLGINIDGLDTGDAFKQIATKISEIDDPALKASAAVDIFGKSGTKLLNILNQGAGGIEAMEKGAAALGITFSAVDAAQVEIANDAMARLGTITTSIGNRLAIELAPIITGIAESLLDASQEGFNFGDIVSTGIDWIVKGLGVALDVVHTLKIGFKALQGIIISGFAHSLDATVFFGKGLENLLNMIPGVEVSFGSMLEGIQESLHASANEIFASVNEDLIAATPSEGLNSWLDDVRAKSQAAAEEIAKTTEGVASLGDGFADASEDASKLIDKLTEQIATFGMSSNEAEIFKLAQSGVSDELLAQISGLDNQLKALENAKSKQEELSSAAQSVIDEQFDSALKQATGKFSTEADKVTLSSPELLAKGSQAEATFLADFRNGRTSDPITDVAMNQDETNRILKDILRALGVSGDKVEEIVAIA